MTLPLTGERTVPGVAAENYWFRRHEVAYEYAADLVPGRRVLEVGCGEGYGTALLSDVASGVLGVDYDPVTVAHAAERYAGPSFVRGNLAALPVRTAAVDIVVALQVVEHVWHHAQFVRECARVLRPGGALLLTTPNRLTFSPGLDVPQNPFHTKEFSAAELIDLMTRGEVAGEWVVESVAGVHAGPRLRELDRRYGSFPGAQLASAPEDWTEELRADVASITTADFEVGDAESADVDASLDLLLVVRAASQ